MIVWAGTSSMDVGMVIEHYPKVIIPKRRVEVEEVPGRNGDIIIETDSFENYDQQYAAFLDSKYIGRLEAVIPKVSAWLLGHSGYQRLEDSYFPDVYRMACFKNGAEFSSVFNEYGEGTLTFNCAPQKFLKSGEISFAVSGGTSGTVITNPTGFTSHPLIQLTSSGTPISIRPIWDGTPAGNSDVVTIANTSGTVYIDTDTRKVWKVAGGTTTNLIGSFSGKFENLYLQAHKTTGFNFSNSTMTITPRWWTI